MRIGVVSDTHNNLPNVRRIVEIFNEAGVDRVVHTGDITQPKTLEVFADLEAPLFGVFGNNDEERTGLEKAVDKFDFHFVEPPLALEWAGRRLVVVHDPLELRGVDESEFDVILHGHTHRQYIGFDGGRLTFNPGECAGMMQGLNSVGVVCLRNLDPEIIKF
ncbi:MAG: metallophosphoesterase [Pseudomonadales bacterium]|nr:metallophosphoesterase [Pseudomonadales bacterium]